ncbi:MAG TPA: hypothetical protein VFP90_00195 [Gemmatimonadaceae bacterium]|nr:hypothetical protein [Gemmatimonadaceae bacterium]
MLTDALPALAGWESFYVIVGGAAAALTGLQFVVITLIADSTERRTNDSIDAFGTPTIVHFCLALLIAAMGSVPWHTLGGAALVLGAIGLGGLAYEAIVIRRTRRQTDYRPVLEDWIWHVVLPLLAYGATLGGALALSARPEPALFAVGVAALLLLFIGIHNAWDTVTYITVVRPLAGGPPEAAEPSTSSDPGSGAST